MNDFLNIYHKQLFEIIQVGIKDVWKLSDWFYDIQLWWRTKSLTYIKSQINYIMWREISNKKQFNVS